MQTILLIIAPIFGLIALGYAAAKSGYLPASSADGLAQFVFGIAMPALLLRTVATADFGGVQPAPLWLAYFAGVIVTYGLAMILTRRLGRVDRRSSVVAGVATSFSNLVFITIPVVDRIYGTAGLGVLALLLTIHLPIMVTASTLLIERAALQDTRDGLVTGGAAFDMHAALRRIWRSLSRNALIIGILCGSIFQVLGLPVAGPFGEIVNTVASTAGPLALIALGLSLPRYKIGSDLKLPLVLASLTLVLQPAIVWLAGQALGLSPLWLQVAVLGAAAPPGVNAYLLAVHFKSGEHLAATLTVVATVISAVTLSLWILVLVP
ncbi:AEC family transporter [Aureimonas mangrovi]|uniref:AEC family transporter n=1 Tax=Aureimonas mangrovi TaxID=2758041 RepID=UPI00163D9D96|nr:AEC family transporter [Aureimonas mangrovi]